MPILKLTNLAAYRTYFQDLATKHVGIAGFKWGSLDVVKNDNRSDIPDSFLWALPYEAVRYGDNGSDNVLKYKMARVTYMEPRDSDLYADEEIQYDRCEAMIEQVLARILRDKRGFDVSGTWTMVVTTIATWKTAPTRETIGSTVYLGFDLNIEFGDNTNLAFDAQKWTDTLTP